MSTYADKTKENKNQSVAATSPQMQSGGESTFQFVDNRPQAVAQRKLQEMANNSPQVKQVAQLQTMINNHSAQQNQPVQKKENNTGLPDNLKSGIENISGYSMDDVKVHYNSDKPAQFQAHAFAQGTAIHLASGQEKHLPHEAWHVVQQKQGRVKPTIQMKGKVNVNDDEVLEKEADVMGRNALQLMGQERKSQISSKKLNLKVVQRVLVIGQTQVTSDKINKKGRYKTKLNRVISQEAKKAHETPQGIRAKLTEMVNAGNHNFPTMRDAVLSAIGEKTGVSGAENTLGAELNNHVAFNNFPQSRTWKLLMDGKHHESRGKFGFENEKGYMSALMNAYTHMLQNLDTQLDVEGYEILHDLAVHNVHDRNGIPMAAGYRDSQVNGEGFGVDGETWSQAGYNELRGKYRNRNENPVGHVLAEDPQGMVGPNVQQKIMKLKPLYRSQSTRFAGIVLEAYHEEIEQAVNDNDQLAAIARCCQDLDQLHLFVDGNIRTIAFLVLNKLLLQNRLDPVVLNEPNIFDCKSIDELRNAIRAGQAKFRSLKV